MFEKPNKVNDEAVNDSRRGFLKSVGVVGMATVAGVAGGVGAPSLKESITDPEPERKSDIDILSDHWVDAVVDGDSESIAISGYVIQNHTLELNALIPLSNSLNKSLVEARSKGARSILEMNIKMTEKRIRFLQDEIKFVRETIENSIKPNNDISENEPSPIRGSFKKFM